MDSALFFELLACMKTTHRRDWIKHNIPGRIESVAEHSYSVAILCGSVPGITAETQKRVVVMALIHDLAEAIIGDTIPSDGIHHAENHTREASAIEFIACTLRSSNPPFAQELASVWHEYKEGVTDAARLVRQIDKLECLNQAILYEEESGQDLDLPQLKPLLESRLERYKEIQKKDFLNITIIFVSGGPGVGKGTQCARIAEEFNFLHISVGDLLRDEANRETSEFRTFIRDSMQNSMLIPAQLTTQLIKQAINMNKSQGKRRFLLDGFPRNIQQAKDFESKISKQYSTIQLDCPEEDLQLRLMHRGFSSKRIDDDSATIVKRLRTFRSENEPVLAHLGKHNPLYIVQGGRPADDVYCEIQKVIVKILQ